MAEPLALPLAAARPPHVAMRPVVDEAAVALLIGGSGLAAAMYGVGAATLAGTLLKDTDFGPAPGDTEMFMVVMATSMCAGAVVFGQIADSCGRRAALCGTSTLAFVGALGCASAGLPSRLLGSYRWQALRVEMTVWHLVMGLGFGGEYPASAAYIVENVAAAECYRVLAMVYFYMALGQLLASAVVVTSLKLEVSEDVTWRFAFAFGAACSLVNLVVRVFHCGESRLFSELRAAGVTGNTGMGKRAGLPLLWAAPRAVGPTLCGACAAWFMHSFARAGLYVHPLFATCTGDDMLFTAATGLPGCMVVFVLALASRRSCQFAGFSILAVGFVVLALMGDVANGVPRKGAGALLQGVLQAAVVAGTGATVRFVPAEVFPTCVRASSLGLAAMAGEAATLAASFLLSSAGPEMALGACACVCALGAAATAQLTPCYDEKVMKVLWRLGPARDARELTAQALERSPAFQECPGCGVMVERAGGCNIITCQNCAGRWCFVCRSPGCSPWACSLDEQGPSIDALPRLLWPRPTCPSADLSVSLADTLPSGG